jgi:Zn-dependent M28 family amino/carboxypeptidase
MRWLKAELEKNCDSVEVQEFSLNLAKGPTSFYNIIGRINPEAPRRILLCAHWDTRPTADMNPIGFKNNPIPGANDGASGVAVLLELARVFDERNPPKVGVDIVLFDGEDYGPGLDMMFLGSKHYARELHTSELARYNYGILLDMVGDKDLDIHPENHSESSAGLIYAVALELNEKLGYDAFKKSGSYTIYDDHLPLIDAGVPTMDLIDFTYPHWHTLADTVDKCSPESLGKVGKAVESFLRNEKP